MKIANDNKAGLLDGLARSTTQAKTQNQPTVDQKGSAGGDRVELSSKKQEINEVKDRVKAQSAVRQDKVDTIREAIQNQTYNVKGELVARSMMKSQLLDQLL